MALQVFHHLRLPTTSSRLSAAATATFKAHSLTLNFRPIGMSPLAERQRQRRMAVASVVEESQERSEPEAESELASELKKAMQERKDKEGDNLWSGVAQEIREIEWPAFRKVLGTTGVVLAVILGSSVVLLSVNAVLAELSDTVFAGKGLQDFFT